MKTLSRVDRIKDCLHHAGGECIRFLKTPDSGDTLEWWSVDGKLIIIQYWGKHDSVGCFRPVSLGNNMEQEILNLDEYINS